jgi:hypothetical protein
MKTISIALLSAFLASNASAFVPASQPNTAFRRAPFVGVPAQRLSARVMMARDELATMERTETVTTLASESSSSSMQEPNLMQKIKDAGVAGILSYTLWEFAFWFGSVPVVLSAYYGVTGHFPDLTDKDDLANLGAEAFAFVNVARFAVPLRIGLALSTTPWLQENVINRFSKKKDDDPADNMRKL